MYMYRFFVVTINSNKNIRLNKILKYYKCYKWCATLLTTRERMCVCKKMINKNTV